MKEIQTYVEDFIRYKESLGYSRKSYEGFLKDFASYLRVYFDGATMLTETMVLGWCIQRKTENEAGFRRRATALRVFNKYLFTIGASEYLMPTDLYPRTGRYTPYLFTDDELYHLFSLSDQAVYDSVAPCKHLIISVVYKLIYFCGLRPNEGRELKKTDLDLANKTLFIRKNKSHRERLIPMAPDVAEMCREYYLKITIAYPDTEYFFPSPKGEPYSAKWLTKQFLSLWNQVRRDGNTSNVRVYDLRHRYATAIMIKWMDEKADLQVMLPYLSAYMGHAKLSDTAYYFHLLPEKLVNTSAIKWDRFLDLIPEVHDEE